ncbi:glycosyltransferase [Bifidobacterium longum]|uniref:glycosyltransferase n=1 Tax=Bifidobacterium longum TaxID=216816 RepID=UPI00117D7D94|nr:glycosyltransferase [Bifidobacterium longum]
MTGPLRVAQVVGRMTGGGVEATVLNHYRHIDRSQVQFDFVVLEDSTVVPTDEITALGGRVFFVPTYKRLSQYLRDCERLFREIKPVIVHSHVNALSVFPLMAAKHAAVPVRIAHSHSTSNPREYAKNTVKIVLKPFATVYPTHYAACAMHTARWLFGKKLADSGKVRIIHNAIDPNAFRFNKTVRDTVRKELGVQPDQLVIGQIGRLCFQKNPLFTLDVFSKLLRKQSDAVLVFIGDGEMREQVEARIHELGIENSVRLLGVKQDVSKFYQALDVLMFPSTYEGLGMVAVEAQAAGLPVLASSFVPQEAALIPELMAFLSLRDPNGWVNALAAVSVSAERANEQTRICQSGYDIEDSARELCDWYLTLAATIS